MTTLEATINPFDKKDGKEPEKIDEIDLESDKDLKEILELYELLYDSESRIKDFLENGINISFSKIYDKFSSYDINNSKINYVLSYISKKGETNPTCAGRFVSALIQRYCDIGNNNLKLHMNGLVLDELACNLNGCKRMPRLNIEIYGDVGEDFAFESKYIDFTLYGKANFSPNLIEYITLIPNDCHIDIHNKNRRYNFLE